MLPADQIRAALGTDSFIRRIEALEAVDSTNTYAKSLAGGEAEPTLVVADEQTAGRGRFDRTWFSEKGKNLTFSILLRTSVPEIYSGLVPLCVAESVAEAAESVVHLPISTKWPNDLFVQSKKFCGMLLESIGSGDSRRLIVGIGLNVNQVDFPPELSATSLTLASGGSVDRLQILTQVVRNLEWLVRFSSFSDLHPLLYSWKNRCTMFGQQVTVQSGTRLFKGTAKDIAEDGALVLQVGHFDLPVYAGEVTVVDTG